MIIRPRIFWQSVCLSVAFLTAGAAVQIGRNAAAYNIRVFRTLFSGWVPLFVVLFAIVGGALLLLVLSWTPAGTRLGRWLGVVESARSPWRIAGAAGFVLLLPVLPLIVVQPFFARFLDGAWTRLAILLWLSLAGMFVLKLGRGSLSWIKALGAAALGLAIFHNAVVNFAAVGNFPFSQAWSDVSRYYGASLFMAERIYGATVPQAVLHPAYHLMLVPPFLLGNAPIWVHRLWQVLLQVGLTAVLAALYLRRFGIRRPAQNWLAAGWAFLFLMQGPIQSHLLVCAIIVVAGAAPSRFWRTTVVVLLASIWAGLCRINWFPVPGMLAAVVYLHETPLEAPPRPARYLWRPALWLLLGTAAAFASNLLFMRWSGNGNSGNFVSSLNSDLLWYRLLPNSSYAPGILPEILLASLPMILLIVSALRLARGAFHPLRLTLLFAGLAVLFAGGLVVSSKIGGGHGLHNLDAYLVMLMLVSAYQCTGRAVPERGRVQALGPGAVGLVVLAIAIPAWFSIKHTPKPTSWDTAHAAQLIQEIKSLAEAAVSRGGEVLFLSERQLIAFYDIQVPLVPEYEQDFLMEMVMSHSRPYLDRFQADLRARRFDLIVAFPQGDRFAGSGQPFSEENNYWVTEVSVPLLCNYEWVIASQEFQLASYVPRDEPCE